jgi:hypothetical protein
MFRSVIRAVAIVVFTTQIAGCGWMHFGRRRMADAKPAGPLMVGRVSLVNEDERFALIEADLVQPPAAGTMLRIAPASGAPVELRATGVRRRPFFVADLVRGIPAKGDAVIQLPPDAAASPAPVATTPALPPRKKSWLGFLWGRK